MKAIKKLIGMTAAVFALAICALAVPTHTAKADGTVDVTNDVYAGNWISQNELKVTYLSLGEGVILNDIGYGLIDNAGYTYAQDYIAVNGRTVKEINTDESLGAKNWTYTVFPSTMDNYKMPIILFVNNETIEIKIHSDYVAMLGDKVEITAKAGLYFNNAGTRYEVMEDKTFTVWETVKIVEEDVSANVTLSGWASTGDAAELTYACLSFGKDVLPSGIDYGILDRTEYMYLQEYILLNGKSVKEINETTDTSSYEFFTFPSTADAKYRLPVILFVNNGLVEVKVHNTYIASLGDTLEITVKEGLSVVNGAKKFVVGKNICYILEGDVWADKDRTYVVSYYLNGELYGEVEYLKYKAPFVLKNAPTMLDGYVFSGWEHNYQAETVVQDMQIYGYTTPVRYSVTYHLNGGVNDSTNPIVYYVTDGEIVLKDATKEGAIFKGWYTSDSYTEKVETLSPDKLGDVELYALFEGGAATEEEGGCGSFASVGGGMVALIGAAMLLKKKRIEDEDAR